MWIIRKTLNDFLSFLFPVRCFTCNCDEIILCDACLKNISKCVETPFVWIFANYSFKDAKIKKIIYAIKYHHRKDLIIPLVSSVVTKKFREDIKLLKNPLFVPIPMSTIRYYTRGYNHSELLALEFSRQLNIPVDTNILIKTEATKQQAKIKSRKDRFMNTKNTFAVINEENILDRHIILVDDVTTTGSTFLSAYNTLQKSGFKNISAISIAH